MPRVKNGKETRKWPRLPLAIPIFVRSKEPGGRESLEFATALNVSAGGALLAVRRSLPLSAEVLLEIPSAPLATEANLPKASHILKAKTLRITHADNYHLVGLKFLRALSASQVDGQPTKRKKTSQ
ncbi:MAG TPA: PilZ domain-containing protein [Terriglobales bacterium]